MKTIESTSKSPQTIIKICSVWLFYILPVIYMPPGQTSCLGKTRLPNLDFVMKFCFIYCKCFSIQPSLFLHISRINFIEDRQNKLSFRLFALENLHHFIQAIQREGKVLREDNNGNSWSFYYLKKGKRDLFSSFEFLVDENINSGRSQSMVQIVSEAIACWNFCILSTQEHEKTR